MPTAEPLLLAKAVLRHRPFPFPRLSGAHWWRGNISRGGKTRLQQYADSIDMVSDGYRYVRRNRMLLCLGLMELIILTGQSTTAHALRRVVRVQCTC